MKITPLEIRQKQFERTMRGYDKDEVSGFLVTLSSEWERMQDDAKEMRLKLDSSEREVIKLREVEGSLYKTLKTAEDTGSNLIEQAHKAAELHMRETQLKAEGMLNEVKAKAKDTVELAEDTAKQMLGEMEERLKSMIQQYKTLESQRDNLLADLKRLAGETMDRVERAKSTTKEFDPDHHLNVAKREAKKVLFPNADFEPTFRTAPIKESVIKEETLALSRTEFVAGNSPTALEPVLTDDRKPQKSFFDDIQ
jgi:cell division initiation protein